MLSRQNTGAADKAFEKAGRAPGLEIWRINKFQVIPVDHSEYGFFYDGDCYIVLNTKHNNRWDVHFWLGKHSTVDEQGTAAIKTVELDEFLGGGPVEYRELKLEYGALQLTECCTEVQGYESPLFLSYFKSGIKYMKGGHESGFKKISDSKREMRLFCCKGKRNVRVKQVKCSRDSLNLGDVFILDNFNDIYVWCPPECGRLEKNKGVQVATDIKDQEHAGRGNVHILDENWNSHEAFWKLLGGKGPVQPASAGGCDEEQLFVDKQQVALYKVSDATGTMKIEKVAGEGELLTTMLDSNDCFILDAASSGIYVWIGKNGNNEERKNSMQWAKSYIEMMNKPVWTPIVRVLDDAEPSVFLQWFKDAEEAKHKKFKSRLYHCSDNSGKLLVEEICNYEQQDLVEDDVMILDAGLIVYVWIGAKANDREKKHARKTAQNFIEGSGLPRPPGASTMTVQQGKETSEFTKHFPSWDKNFWANRKIS
uniref:Gelsolin-like domain-containing protein n=1 Tax=Romanomermis culicivorax TaxID=13658 RepID=A0A915JM93_ROMCU